MNNQSIFNDFQHPMPLSIMSDRTVNYSQSVSVKKKNVRSRSLKIVPYDVSKFFNRKKRQICKDFFSRRIQLLQVIRTLFR